MEAPKDDFYQQELKAQAELDKRCVPLNPARLREYRCRQGGAGTARAKTVQSPGTTPQVRDPESDVAR